MALTFDIGFRLDKKDLDKELGNISNDIARAFQLRSENGISKEIKEAVGAARTLDQALRKATTDKGISYSQLNVELAKAGTTAGKLTATLAAGGSTFTNSLNQANNALALSNRSVISLNRTVQEIGRVFKQSFKFTAAQTVIREIAKEAQAAVRWVTDLNDAVNEIAVVTGKTGDEIEKVSQAAIRGSRELRIAAEDYARGALIFYQQGLNDEEVTRRNEITIKAAKAANQSIQQMSSQLTAIWNTYGMVGDEQLRAASVGARMAAETAVDFQDIATAMQSAAAPAAQMGVEYNQLAAIIATVGDVTQQSASTIGNAYKTIFSRFQQLRAEGTDGEVTLSSVSQQLDNLGIKVLDSAGNLRDLGIVINEVGQNWDNWSQTQQTAIAQIVGGTRQYGQFLALMQNFDKYQKNLQSASMEDGSTLEAQYTQAIDSIESRAENAAEAWHRAFAEVITPDQIKGFYSAIEGLGNAVGSLIKGLGGAPGILAIIFSMLSSKIVPTLMNAGRQISGLWNSLTPERRTQKINKDFNDADAAITRNTGNLSNEEVQIARSKNEFSRQTALINEQINTKLETATGAYRTQLQMAKEMLDSAQKRYQVALDEQQSQGRALEMERTRLQVLERELIIQEEAARVAASATAHAQSVATRRYNQAVANRETLDPSRLRSGVTRRENNIATTESQIEDARQSGDIARVTELTEKLARQRQGLAQATEELERREQAYQQALRAEQEAEQARNAAVDANSQARLNLTLVERERAINQVAQAYNNLATATINYDRSERTTQDFMDMVAAVREIINTLGRVPGAAELAGQELGQLSQRLDETRDDDELQNIIVNLNGIRDAIAQINAEVDDSVLERHGDLQQVRSQQDRSREDADRPPPPPDSNDAPKIDFSQTISGLTQLASAATMATTEISTLIRVFSDAESSFGDKIGAIVGIIPTTLAMITSFSGGVVLLGKAMKVAGYEAEGFGLKMAAAGIAAKLGFASIGAMVAAFAAGLLAVVAIVGLFYAAWKEGENRSPENQLKKAKEAADELAKAEESAKKAAEDLKSTFDTYNDAREQLDSCTRGTKEWEEALKKVNEAAINVVNSLPSGFDVTSAYSRNNDGMIEINEGAIRAAQKSLGQRAVQASYATQVGQLNVGQKQRAVDSGNIASQIVKAGGAAQSSVLTRMIDRNAEDFLNITIPELQQKLKEFGVNINNLDNSELQSLQNSLQALAENANNAAEKMELVSKLQVDEQLGDSYSGDEKDLAAQGMVKATEASYKEYFNALTNQLGLNNGTKYGDISKFDTKINSELLADYNRLTGNNYSSSANGVQGTDTERVFEFIDNATGEVIQKTAEVVAQEMAAGEALQNLGASAELAREALNGLGQDAINYVNNGNMDTVTYEDLKDLLSGDDETQDRENVADFFGGENQMKKIIAAQNGLKSAAEVTDEMIWEFVDSVLDSVYDSKQAIQTAGNGLSSVTRKVYNDLLKDGDLDQITAAGSKNLTDSLVNVFNSSGEKGVEEFKNILEGMGSTVDDFANYADQIDWNNDGPDLIRQKLKDLSGTSIQISDEDLPKLIKMMQKSNDVSLKSATDQYNSLRDIYKAIDGNDSVLSPDQIAILEKAGISADMYFQRMADGTYALKGDADEFKSIVDSLSMQGLYDVEEQTLDRIKTLAGLQETYNAMGGDSAQLNAEDRVSLLQQGGYASNEQVQKWNDMLSSDEDEVQSQAAEEIYEAFAKAEISSEGIKKQMEEAARQADEIQGALAESEFRNEVEKAGFDVDETKRYAKRLKELNKEQGMSEDQARRLAIANQKLDRGVSNLNDNLKDYKKSLKESNKGSAEWSKTMDSLKGDLADIFDFADKDLISDDFAEGLLDNKDLTKALDGDTEALQRLRWAATQDLGNTIVDDFKAQVQGEMAAINADGSAGLQKLKGEMAESITTVDNAWSQIQEIMNRSMEGGFIKGEDIESFETAMNDMISATGMTKDQITSMLGSMGVDATIVEGGEMQPKDVPQTETTRTVTGRDPETNEPNKWTEVTRNIEPFHTETWVPTYSIRVNSDEYTSGGKIATEGTKGQSGNFQGSKLSTGTVSTGSTTSGKKTKSGGSKTPVKRVQKTEKNDKQRYTDNENAVEDVTKAVDRLSKANDHAFGPQKIRNLNLMNIQLAKQAKALQGLYNEAKMYIKLDASTLVSGLDEFNKKYGTTLAAVFDGDNLLDNEMEIMNIITDLQNAKIDEINAVEAKINELAAKNVSNDDPKVKALNNELEKLKENLSDIDTDVESMVKKNLDNYQEAIRKAEETMQQMVDILHQGLANEIEKYTLARDLHIQINDLEREHWEAIMDNMGEVGKLGKQTADMLSKSLTSLGNSIDRYIKHYGQMEDVQKRWENRDITLKAEYGITDEVWDRAQQSGMIPQEIMDAFEGDIDALMALRQEVWDNLDKQWQNYIDTIQYYIDEYDRITDRLDKQASISDNLLSLIDTVGFNYKWGADENAATFKNMNAQMDIIRNKAKVVNGELEIATNRRIEAEQELNKLLAGRSAKEFADNASEAEMFEYDRIKAHYDEMADLEAELNEQRISLLNEAYEKATEYAEKWGEVLAHESEKALNAMFSTYDQAMDMYNQKRDIDTFFMDEEDKVFELNKLQREINKTIEDATDPEMLNRYNELLKEIDEKKQAGVKMTEKDLEILQAQFDLEQARDAYEDARNAKNTMRLARDASGNWSYIYSADSSQTEDQAAAIEEKLHNIRKLNRDAADEYSETWLQLQVDWDNYIKSIDKARFEQEEEYRKEVEQRNNWYAEQSNLLSGEIIKHNDAIDRSFEDTTLGVIINFEDMALANETYKENHNQLREKLRENYQSWIDKANETKDEVGGSMQDLEQVVNEETGKMMDEVDQLGREIDTLNADAQNALGQLERYISGWVTTVNSEFQTTIDQIDALIDAYLRMLEVMAQQADANAADPNYEYNAELNSTGLSYNRLREIKKNSSSYEEFLEKAQNDKDLQYWAWNGVQKGEQMSGQGHAGADYWKDKYGGDVDKALDSMIDHIWNEAADKINHKSEETDKSQQAINSNNKYRAATGGLFEHPAVTEIAENGPEIVLNRQDTENILKAVSMMREAVGKQMGAKSLALDSMVANASASASDYTPAAQEMQFDQNVKIEAVFPGVSAAGEIEQALNSIITQAAQYRIKK